MDKLEAFATLFAGFVTATSIYYLALQVRSAEHDRIRERVLEHARMVLERAEALVHWSGPDLRAGDDTEDSAPVLRHGLASLERALERQTGAQSVGAVRNEAARYRVHCRLSELETVVRLLDAVLSDVETQRQVLGAEQVGFLSEMLACDQAKAYLEQRSADMKTGLQQTKDLAFRLGTENRAAEADLIALFDTGFLVFFQEEDGVTVNIVVDAFDARDLSLPLYQQAPSVDVPAFLAAAREQLLRPVQP